MTKPSRKQRLSVYLDPAVMNRLAEHAARRDHSRSLVAEAVAGPGLIRSMFMVRPEKLNPRILLIVLMFSGLFITLIGRIVHINTRVDEPTTINRILIWGLVGIGFDLLFGYTGLLSFGQSAFFGTGGMFAAYLLTQTSFTNTIAAVFLGTIAAGVIGYLVGLIALRRTGIYFGMITVAILRSFLQQPRAIW